MASANWYDGLPMAPSGPGVTMPTAADATPTASDLIARAKSFGPDAYVPSQSEAQQMADDLAQIAARRGNANGAATTAGAASNAWWSSLPAAPTPAAMDVAPQASASSGASPSFGMGLQDTIMHGATFGLSDNAAAAGDASTKWLMGKLGLSQDIPWSQRYSQALSRLQGDRQAFAQQHPVLAPLANVAGSLAAGPAKAGQAVLSTGNALLDSALYGAGFGGVSGFGNASGNIGDRLRAAGQGAAFGAGVGVAAPYVLPPILRGISLPFNFTADTARPFFAAGRQQIAGNILREAAGTAPTVAQAAPIPGMQLSTGQATNNPGLLWLERSVQQGSPLGAQLSADARTANNQALRDAIAQLGDPASADAASRMAAALDQAQQRARATERQVWGAIDPNRDSWIPTQPLKDAVGQYLKDLPKAYRADVPADVLDVINNQFGRVEGIDQFQALRSSIGSEIRAANATGNANRARILSGIQDILDDHLENLPGVPQDMLQRYQAARGVSRQYNATFKQPDIRKALGVDASGMPRVPDSATADQFIRAGKGAPEAWQAYLNAVGNDPAAMEAARDAFSQKFLNAAASKIPDAQGDALLNAGKIRKFVTDYQHVISSPLFTDAQRNLINSIADAADMAARTARAGAPGGSDTYAKLSGERFLDALIGRLPARLLTSGAGALTGYMMEGHLGAIAGAALGGAEGGRLANLVYAAPKEKILALIDQAVHDPQVAQSLMWKATPQNLAFAPRQARSSLAAILVGKLPALLNDQSPKKN